MQEKKRTRTLRCANGRVRTFSTCKSHLEDMSLEFFGIQFLSSNCSVSEAGVMLFTAQTMCFQLSSCSGFFFFFKLSLVCHNLSAIAEPTPNWLRCYDAICCSYILNMRHWRYSPAHTHTHAKSMGAGFPYAIYQLAPLRCIQYIWCMGFVSLAKDLAGTENREQNDILKSEMS